MCSKTVAGFFIVASLTAIIDAQSSCTTPNGEAAQCISIYSCSVLFNAVRTRNAQQLSFLRESQCGYKTDPLVCCGSSDNYQQAPSRRTPPKKPDRTPDRRGASGNALPDRSTCGFQDANRILDGQVTALNEFPWMALLQYRKSNGNLVFSCGGTLISSKYVLTASHCVTGKILTKIGPLVNVRLGEWNTDTDQDCVSQFGFEICSDPHVDAEVESTTVHPDYTDSNVNRYGDLALIRLKRDVTFSEFIRPICLPSSSDKARVGERLTVAGWGRTENANSSPAKLKLKVPIAQPSQCANKFRSAGVTIDDTQLCAGGERGRDSCSGDSGGPLMNVISGTAQWYLEGIVSFGAKCGSQGWPGIYTRVSEYVGWIQANVRD